MLHRQPSPQPGCPIAADQVPAQGHLGRGRSGANVACRGTSSLPVTLPDATHRRRNRLERWSASRDLRPPPDLRGPLQRLRQEPAIRSVLEHLGQQPGQPRVPDRTARRRLATGSGRVAGAPVTWSWSEVSTRRNRTPTATVARQPAHSRPIQTAAAPTAIRPAASAGQMMNAGTGRRRRVSWPARGACRPPGRLTSGLTVGARTVSPSPNSAVKPNTKAIHPMAAAGSAARPNTAQETARISPLTASALLRRARRTQRSTNSWVTTMRAVLTVHDKATTRADTCASTDA
jgi:hypothetical protein